MASRSCNSTTASRSAASPSSLVVRLEETGELLEQTCGEISDATTTELIEVANSVAAQRKMQDLLPVYFHSWQLQSPESIMVFLLLSYFVLKRECTGLKRDRQSFEDHIERLQTRVEELILEQEQVSSATTNEPCSLPVHNAEQPLRTEFEGNKIVISCRNMVCIRNKSCSCEQQSEVAKRPPFAQDR